MPQYSPEMEYLPITNIDSDHGQLLPPSPAPLTDTPTDGDPVTSGEGKRFEEIFMASAKELKAGKDNRFACNLTKKEKKCKKKFETARDLKYVRLYVVICG